MKRFSDAAVLDALWSWCGHVGYAAKSIGLNRGQAYLRLPELGVGPAELKELRETGRLFMSDQSGRVEYVPRPGAVRYLQPVQDSLVVRMKSGTLPPSFGVTVSATTAATSTPTRLRWSPKPARRTTIAFEQAVL